MQLQYEASLNKLGTGEFRGQLRTVVWLHAPWFKGVVCCAGIEDWVLNANIASIKLNTYVDSGE